MLVFSVFTLVVMAIIGGIAVDIGYYERSRTDLQTSLDSAVLAAASLSQKMEPQEVVESYLASAGFPDLAVDVVSTTEEIGDILVGRTVRASLTDAHETLLMRLFGQETLGLGVTAQATERVDDIEISLVLDVSGSMEYWSNGKRKIDHLREAASTFVEDVLEDAENGRVSISIVPYSTKVNAGEALLDTYTVSGEHAYSHCIDFGPDDFLTSGIDPNAEQQRTGHFQFQGMREDRIRQGQWTCRIDEGFAITPLSNSVGALHERIDLLSPEGSTSIDMGVKWGLALLDPSAKAPVSALVSQGRIDPAFEGRPHAFGEENTMKVLVIMTDGKNDTEYRLAPSYASGPSDLIRLSSESDPDVYYMVDSPEGPDRNDGEAPSGERFFYADHPFDQDGRMWSNERIQDRPDFPKPGSGFTEKILTWPEIWNEMSPRYYTYNMHGMQKDGGWNRRNNHADDKWREIYRTLGTTEKDKRLKQICDVARSKGVVTFSVGFEVPSKNSLDLLKHCASTEAHYFDVEGLEIESAFEMIASSISMLRLTK